MNLPLVMTTTRELARDVEQAGKPTRLSSSRDRESSQQQRPWIGHFNIKSRWKGNTPMHFEILHASLGLLFTLVWLFVGQILVAGR